MTSRGGAADPAAARIAALEQEAARLHDVAKQHNLRGDFEGAEAAYRRMYAVEDEALQVAADTGEQQEEAKASASPAEYATLLPLPASPWASRVEQQRALGAVLGGVVADAAAMGVHWVYDPKELDRLSALRMSKGKEEEDDMGLAFYEPPRSPFFSYESGRASPYGEQVLQHLWIEVSKWHHSDSRIRHDTHDQMQTLVLLASLADQGGLHPLRYAEALAQQFGRGWDGYRDVQLKGFLRAWYRGQRPPYTGAPDAQANCFTRLAPVVAAYHCRSGHGLRLLLAAVERATRVTQDDDRAVAWAQAGAVLLSRVIGGLSVDGAVASVVADLTDVGSVLCGADGRFAELNEEIAGHLKRVHEMAREGQSVQATVAALGRNCHLPNSFQTPLHAALLCSLQAAKPPSTMTTAERRRLFKTAVCAVIREGGCCASRATYVGACLGAWLASSSGEEAEDMGESHALALDVVDFLPPEWTARVTAFGQTQRLAETLVTLRGCM